MPTWRERIVAARERGAFHENDLDAWRSPITCVIGETAAQFFDMDSEVDRELGYPITEYACIDNKHPGMQRQIYLALIENRVDDLERLLDAVEDSALQLKREATS